MNVNIRPYQAGDTSLICALFTRCSPYLRDTAFWVWINRMLGTDNSITVVAEADNKIVGHYAIIPHRFTVNGQVVDCGFGIHAIVEEQYKNDVAIYQITDLAYKIAKSKGLKFVYGFPNANYRLVQQKIERWQQVALFNAYELSSKFLPDTHSRMFRIEQVTNFDYSHICTLSELLDMQVKAKVELEKTVTYYLNRYVYHPQKLYSCHVILSNNKTIGYVFIKHYTKQNNVYCHIVDYVLFSGCDQRTVITDIFLHFTNSCDVFSVWKGDHIFEDVIKQLGFITTGFDTFLGVKILDKGHFDDVLLKTLLDFDNWKLVMGDSDAF